MKLLMAIMAVAVVCFSFSLNAKADSATNSSVGFDVSSAFEASDISNDVDIVDTVAYGVAGGGKGFYLAGQFNSANVGGAGYAGFSTALGWQLNDYFGAEFRLGSTLERVDKVGSRHIGTQIVHNGIFANIGLQPVYGDRAYFLIGETNGTVIINDGRSKYRTEYSTQISYGLGYEWSWQSKNSKKNRKSYIEYTTYHQDITSLSLGYMIRFS